MIHMTLSLHLEIWFIKKLAYFTYIQYQSIPLMSVSIVNIIFVLFKHPKSTVIMGELVQFKTNMLGLSESAYT